MNVIWSPQPRQEAFMSRPEFECLYGGAAGGGKSDALVVEATRQVEIPHYKGLLLRRTTPQLSELIEKSQLIYPRAFPGCKYNDNTHTWRFPSGAKIIFGHMQHEKDKLNYQGKAYDFVGFDELTHFTHTQYTYLFSRCRPNGPGTRTYIRGTTNPGGIGHAWVKDRFIDIAPPMTPVEYVVEIKSPTGELIRIKRKRIFVPATVFDNKKLLENDPGYLATLGMMPEQEKQALLYGDWNSFSGQVFIEFENDPSGYKSRKWSHVIDPFKIPEHWIIYRAMDWGYSRPFSVGWYAVAPTGKIYRIRELYGCTGTPNEGVKWTSAKVAKKIKEIEREDPNISGRDIFGIADPAIFAADDGESIADTMANYEVYFEKGDHQRVPGKMQCHYRLAFDEDGDCMFQVFNTCRHFIRTIPSLVYSETDVEDINTEQEDHCLIGTTEVWTDKGRKQIRDMVGSTWNVLSSDGRYHVASDVRCTRRDVEVFTVELEDGTTITATANHRFRLADGSWKRLDELKDGDDLWTMK